MLLAPVILFVYNRPSHTKEVIERLSKNTLAKDTKVFVFSDAAKHSKDLDKVEDIRKYLNHLTEMNYFSEITIYEQEKNKGLANSVIDGVSKIIKEYKKVIVLEDDLITSKDFLVFMNEALNFYKDNSKIWSISGYNLPIKIPTEYKEDVYLSFRASSWGWGTWENRWEMTDWSVKDYKEFYENNKSRKSFNKGGRDLSFMLDDQMNKKIDSWAIRWCYSQWRNKMYTIYPIKSKIQNIGLDGSGTHSPKTSKYNVLLDETSNFKLSFPKKNRKILRRFQNSYISYCWYFLVNVKKTSLKIIRKFENYKKVRLL